jgi:hypothetical protein
MIIANQIYVFAPKGAGSQQRRLPESLRLETNLEHLLLASRTWLVSSGRGLRFRTAR